MMRGFSLGLRCSSRVLPARAPCRDALALETVLDRIAYDTAGRMVSWKTPDSELTWGQFDLEGRPKRTTQRRFRNATGLTTAILLDEFEQQHVYNEHGERTFTSMPIYAGLTLSTGWTKGIAEQHDAMGNVTSIARASAPGASGSDGSSRRRIPRAARVAQNPRVWPIQ